eukprot:1028958_1
MAEMIPMLFSLFCFIPTLSLNVHIGSSLLPRADTQFALGYYNDVIKLYGAQGWNKQFMSFDVSSETFTDHGSNYLPTWINGGGQFYAQLANTLYVINPNGNGDTQYIASFDLTNDEFVPSSIAIPNKVFANSCIGAHTNFLAIVGGYNYGHLSALYFYDLTTEQWTQPAHLTYGREIHSCIVHPTTSRFYVLGGISDSNYSPLNIETYHASNPSVFSPLPNNLLNPVWRTRLVLYGDDIYVVGGYDPQSGQDAMQIQIIDTVQQTVRYGPSLAYGTLYAPVVIVNDVLYCFGGYNIDKWQYLHLTPTMNPTQNPTIHPTVNPSVSVNPSINPTMNPTENPSNTPSVNPTFNPTINPSVNPSQNPTENPSINPTFNPTVNPLENPSINPSMNPSLYPSIHPSMNPTINPTFNPSIHPTINPSLYPTTHPTINPDKVTVRDGQVHEVT